MKPVLWIDAVGLTARQLGADTPAIAALAQKGASAPMRAVLPALTLSAQASMLTGRLPREHGIVGNGWYVREVGEPLLWRQPNELVAGEKIYERAARLDPSFTCAKIFWWWNLGARVAWSVTPRPFYPADGRKIPAIYAAPAEYGRDLESALGPFPFFDFWGPRSSLASSQWLARAALRTLERQRPSLTMVYLPHLDYDHQRFGPQAPRSREALRELDALVGELARGASACGAEVLLVSEYGLEDARQVIPINRALREAGLLSVRDTPVGEILDPFASAAFALADHQIAHVYLRDPQRGAAARACLEQLPGIARVCDRQQQAEFGLDHPRSGDLVALAAKGAWFSYGYWLDEQRAPDFARTVDIHRKPGYDPCELFLDPRLRAPKLRIALRLAQKLLGMRYLMDVIPLDANLVRGTHGRAPDDVRDGPLFVCSRPFGECGPSPADGVVELLSLPERVLALLQRDGGR